MDSKLCSLLGLAISGPIWQSGRVGYQESAKDEMPPGKELVLRKGVRYTNVYNCPVLI